MDSRHQRVLVAIVISFVILLIIVAAFMAIRAHFRPHVSLRLGDGVFTAYLAQSSSEHQRGLSDVKKLPADEALLFVYEEPGIRSVWMKDMKIPIDVVWLDTTKRVIYTVENLSPDTYPTTYTAKKPAQYVIELPAGTIKAKAINLGAKAVFNLDQPKGVEQ